MTTDTTFVGAKGGVGTSTVAALYALQAARSCQPVRLTAADVDGVEDLAAILGIPAPGPGQAVDVAPGLTLADHRDPEGTNVVDAGTDCFNVELGDDRDGQDVFSDPSVARATDAGLLARVRLPLGLAQLDCASTAH